MSITVSPRLGVNVKKKFGLCLGGKPQVHSVAIPSRGILYANVLVLTFFDFPCQIKNSPFLAKPLLLFNLVI